MKPVTLAFALLSFAMTAPATAMAFSFSLPLLTYPAPQTPDVTQSCGPVVETCTAPAK